MTRISLISLLLNAASVRGNSKLVLNFDGLENILSSNSNVSEFEFVKKMTQNCVIVQFLTNIKVKSHSFDLHEFRTFSPTADILTCQSTGITGALNKNNEH